MTIAIELRLPAGRSRLDFDQLLRQARSPAMTSLEARRDHAVRLVWSPAITSLKARRDHAVRLVWSPAITSLEAPVITR